MSDLEAILETGGAAAVELAASKMSEHGTPPRTCHNCGAALAGPYCAMCGQESDTHRRSMKNLMGDLAEDVGSLDSRILRTARALLFQPGELPRAFREGRTRRYVPALRLYFFVSLIFFLILGISGIAILELQVVATPMKLVYDAKGNPFLVNPAYDPNDKALKYVPKFIPISKRDVAIPGGHYDFSTNSYFFAPIGTHPSVLPPDAIARIKNKQVNVEINDQDKKASAKRQAQSRALKGWMEKRFYGGIARLAADPAAMNGPLTTWIPRVLFLLLPLYALLLGAFYWRQRKKFYLVDHLIFSLSVHTFTFVALIAAAGLAQIISGEAVFWFLLGVIGLYIFLSIKHFYEQSWFWTSVKFLFISGIYTIFILLPALACVIAVSFLDT
jgi:hypothetical protein